MKYYRGNTILFDYSCVDENGNPITLNDGDKLLIIFHGIKNKSVVEEININDDLINISVVIPPEKTKDLDVGLNSLEIQLHKDSNIFTTYTEQITVLESWCGNE